MSIVTTSSDTLNRRRDLAIALMNQGHAQQMGNDPGLIGAALQSYEQAIAILRTLPLDQNPGWANSLGAAWMNRGQLLHRAHGTAQAAAALYSFDEAVAIFRTLSTEANPWAARNFAGTLLNRACLLNDLAEHRAALDSAREALPLATRDERTQLVDADLALKLRRVACESIGHLIPLVGAPLQTEFAAEASDLVDDGLAVARDWAARGERALYVVAIRLFRFGAQLYRLHQPHFLAEFLVEEIGDGAVTPEALAIMHENIDAALAARPAETFLTVGDPASERHVQTARDLTALRQRLPALPTSA